MVHDINMKILQLHGHIVQYVQSISFGFQYLSNKKQENIHFSHPDIFPAEGWHNEITVFLSKF